MKGNVPARDRASGFTLVEAMVAMSLALLVLLISFREFIDAVRQNQSQSQIADMHQNARNLVEFLSRDLMQAGYGMRGTPGDLPAVIANLPTDLVNFSPSILTFRYNPTDVETPLTKDMSSATSDVEVGSTTGFTAGRRAMIWDESGSWEWWLPTTVSSATVLKHTTALAKAYLLADEPVVSVIREVSYRHDAAAERLERQEDGGTWSAVARNVAAFEIHYFDQDLNELFPADDTARRAIRTLRLHLSVRTEEQDLVRGGFRTFDIDTTVAPRNLPNL